MVPSRLPRRTIMAFIHKAPAGFLGLVEDMISLMQAPRAEGEDGPGVAHQFAMDIFAHWLVLMLLLDNVWWIGGIGAWELGRIVQFRRGVRWRVSVWGGGDWWPEGMWEVARQFERFRG
ncbi:hypothetical protein B0H67DRAFT_587199 [Lasiosphaeris hirsuta]|uniref:Uncharacterized protein n=1 Tax=Lasiosphaeris hirsuta TaxID=260670 RepID=A0AA40A0Y8_9PEZI|nr:hypothetical protein B0H67DRAFT_587199 [Lasiosphaeris hirsuta]